ncbi:hypothetical protein R9C00_25520 [Flammeovirgaceae bacterium SG7u.111]|nr:hypothetical protein [Flammeovirgaceae bacterium SG7u.132]WPO35057.1 hypothetical protein R9C00_25520 [Flammeovirgaceae bacterium SG7u.111]
MFSNQGRVSNINVNFPTNETQIVDKLIDEILLSIEKKLQDKKLRRGIFRAMKPSTYLVIRDKSSVNILMEKSFGITSINYHYDKSIELSPQQAYESSILDFGFDDPVLFQVPIESANLDSANHKEFIDNLTEEYIKIELDKFEFMNNIVRVKPIFGTPNFKINQRSIFVIMPFTTPLTDIYINIIKPSVENNEMGLVCQRADDFKTNKSIMQDIWKGICEAKVIIADLTELNPNVMYELGIAHTVGKETILIYQKQEDKEVNFPFDLAHIRRIEYTDSAIGAKKLETELQATLNNILNPNVI